MPLSYLRQRAINGYQHIMACPIAKAWTLLVILHFIVQVALQGITLRDNQMAKAETTHCLSTAQVPIGVPLLEGGDLSLCDGIPGHNNVTCLLIASKNDQAPYSSLRDVASNSLTSFDLDQPLNITLAGHEHIITGRCAVSLQYMYDGFRGDAAEDIATICFQFWLLIVSLLAVIQDSIPHLAVCIASHVLDVGWAGFRIKSTIALRQDYNTFIVDGACAGEDMLGNWWDQRLAHAAPLFGTNLITLILLAALAVVMFQRYAKLNFSRMGASPAINRMYKVALSFSAFLQLAAFFTILAVGMWIDLLSCDLVAALDGRVRSDQASFFVLAVILAPWAIAGWFAVFREVKWAFVLFGVFHAYLLALWPGMLASAMFRYILKTWPFFACVSVASYLFVVATAIIAIICRFHFGRGLGHFLRVESDLSSSGFPASFFTNDPAEKICGDSPSFDFDFLDPEKARKGSIETKDDARPYALELSKYSAHSISFDTPKNASKTPVRVPPPTTHSASTAIIKALKKGHDTASLAVTVDSESRPTSYVSRTHNDDPENIHPSDRELPLIRPPPEAHIQIPCKGTRSRKETSSMMTQATGVSTNSSSQAVITHARKDPVLSANARTIATSTMFSKRAPSPVDTVMPHEHNPSIDLGRI